MVSTILVPLDGSILARHALPFATFLARSTRARLVLLHACRPKPLDPEADPELDLIQEHADLATGLRERGVHASTWLSYDEPGPAIVNTAAELQTDLIVMSTHGRGGVGQLLYGSVAEYVARHSSVPVILVTTRSRLRWVDEQPLRVLVPLDGSADAERALGPAAVLGSTLHAGLVLLRVAEEAAPGTEQQQQDVAWRYLEQTAAPLRSDGLDVEVRVESGPPPDAIARVAEELASSLVVMATHGRGALSRLLLESVATEALRKLTVPVYLVRGAPHYPHVIEGTPAQSTA
jgi:nucleotide-binding universal stress UspA family protein